MPQPIGTLNQPLIDVFFCKDTEDSPSQLRTRNKNVSGRNVSTKFAQIRVREQMKMRLAACR